MELNIDAVLTKLGGTIAQQAVTISMLQTQVEQLEQQLNQTKVEDTKDES